MLKRKFQELLLDPNQKGKKFETLYEAAAVHIVGGDCTTLESCSGFQGSCGSLRACGILKEIE